MSQNERGLALRNGFVVGMSLLGTWSVALLVRLVLPRHLGPSLFGEYAFAEALAITGFGFVGFGIDMYIQKEIPLRPAHASDFYGGTQLLRVLAAAVVIASIGFIAQRSGHSREVVLTAMGFGISQLCYYAANTCATLLYAARSVGRLSVLNIATKLLWAAAIIAAIVGHAKLWAFALAAALSELVRFVALFAIARRVVDLRVRFDVRETLRVLEKSAPYYLNIIAIVLYSKIDVTIMGFLLPNRELGFYGAATNISSVAMLLAPLIQWVVTPELARAAVAKDELYAMMRRALEWTLVIAIPVALMLGLGADFVIRTVFGLRFAPAVGAMRVLAPLFVVVYVAMLGSTAMIMLERAWTVTIVTLVSFVVNGLLNFALVRVSLAALGEGGGGIGAAAISVGTEAIVAATYVALLGRGVFDRKNVGSVLKSLGVCAAVIALHLSTRRIGPARLVLDMLVYAALAIVTGAIRVRELYAVVVSALRGRKKHAIS
ncbi:MAG TPA: oligosaccharide flippase family protein [Polyangiaceae bacterium]|jgi:O-antigen/teichoic acid export membrane protein